MQQQRATFTILFLAAIAVGFASCKEAAPPQTKAEVKKVDAEPEPPVIGRLTFMEKNVFRYLRDTFAGARTIHDVTSCPGADTCNLAVTRSRELTTAIDAVPPDGGSLAFRTFGPWA